MPEVKPEIQTFAKIKVVGVGGGGGAAINRMIQCRIKGVEFLVANTDLQALQSNLASNKIHIGKSTTKGLGAGMNPAVGRKSAEESQNEIREMLKGADLVFITCGLGGGTGSGAAPKIAEIAKELGALTIAVVTKPFSFEGGPRKTIAEEALKEFKNKVDTLITIPNDRIWQIIDKKTPLLEAFGVVDEVLRQGVQGISELITLPGLINVDYADVKTIMSDSGSALMGMGESSGDNRAIEAAKSAISSPLLEMSIEGAKGILFTITGGPDLTMYEVSEAAKSITESVDGDAKIIFGAVVDENLKDQLKITVVATGFDDIPGQSNIIRQSNNALDKTPHYFVAQEPRREEKVEERPAPVSTPVAPASTPVQSPFSYDAKKLEQDTLNPEEKDVDRIKPEEVISKPGEANADDEDLEIPAFIRRKMM
ncbi:cell division protein FtsZ [Candidatus Falkowbacteria bacterium]|jgi:cell division protein FtsZ|nr:cell division protein FtsZ [Candidatus Falkowbacteria bacterium]MBT7007702.1 cell division protein FtsZ [Candidatus Falkowbacteria bacterium]